MPEPCDGVSSFLILKANPDSLRAAKLFCSTGLIVLRNPAGRGKIDLPGLTFARGPNSRMRGLRRERFSSSDAAEIRNLIASAKLLIAAGGNAVFGVTCIAARSAARRIGPSPMTGQYGDSSSTRQLSTRPSSRVRWTSSLTPHNPRTSHYPRIGCRGQVITSKPRVPWLLLRTVDRCFPGHRVVAAISVCGRGGDSGGVNQT